MQRNEKGVALLVVIFALLLLSGLAFGLLYMTDSETLVNSNYRSSQQAYYAALAGLQNVRERMTPANTAPHLLVGPAVMPGTPGSILYVINPHDASDSIDLASINGGKYSDSEIQTELGRLGVSGPFSNYAFTAIEDPLSYGSGGPNMGLLNYKWVRVTLKGNNATSPVTDASVSSADPICYNGVSEIPASKITVGGVAIANCFAGGGGTNPPGWTPVYQLTALAVTPSRATRLLQMEVAQNPPIVTNAAMDSQDNVHLNGQLTVNGYDYCSCTCTARDSQGNCTRWGNRAPRVCDASKYAIYASGTVDPPNSSETIVAGPNPPYVQNQPWPWSIDDLIDRFRNDAVNVTGPPYNWNCTGANCGNRSNPTLGTLPASGAPTSPVSPSDPGYQVTYVPGDVQLSGNNSQGFGVLIVDGDLDIHGGFTFDGLIIVRGVISFTGGGSAGVNIYGGIIAGEQSLVDNTLGGSVNINYDVCSLPQGDKTKPPRILSLRDLNF